MTQETLTTALAASGILAGVAGIISSLRELRLRSVAEKSFAEALKAEADLLKALHAGIQRADLGENLLNSYLVALESPQQAAILEKIKTVTKSLPESEGSILLRSLTQTSDRGRWAYAAKLLSLAH